MMEAAMLIITLLEVTTETVSNVLLECHVYVFSVDMDRLCFIFNTCSGRLIGFVN